MLHKTMFEDDIKKTVQWYLDNRKYWELLSLDNIGINRKDEWS